MASNPPKKPLTFGQILLGSPLLALCFAYLICLTLAAFSYGFLAEFKIYTTGYSFWQSTASVSDTLQEPSWKHWFGTDLNGRDVLTRVLMGAQISLLVTLFGTVVSLTVGVTYGLISGYVGGLVDNLMMRVVDILFALPSLLIAIIFITICEPGLQKMIDALSLTKILQARVVLLILFLGLTQWMTMARIVRGQVLVLRQLPFVQAAKALGQSHSKILTNHLLPNLSGIIVVYLTLTIPAIMVSESFLSFLGLGVQAPLASWGTLIADAAGVLNPIKIYWWLILFPSATMTLTLLALNFLGDYLRDRFDPRTRK